MCAQKHAVIQCETDKYDSGMHTQWTDHQQMPVCQHTGVKW